MRRMQTVVKDQRRLGRAVLPLVAPRFATLDQLVALFSARINYKPPDLVK